MFIAKRSVPKDGGGLDNLTLYVHLLMLVLFVGWVTYFLYAVWRFRASANPHNPRTGLFPYLSET